MSSTLFDDREDSNLENKPKRVLKCYPSSPGEREGKGTKLFPLFEKGFRPKEVKRVEDVSRKRRRTLLTKDPQGMTQMILDAGQKEIGPKFCDQCGLLYSPGDFDDEEEHRKAHVKIDNTFQLTLWKDARIIFNYPEDDSQIIMVQVDKDGARVKNRLKDFLAWLDSELGTGYNPSGLHKNQRIFLYTVRTTRKNVVRVLGCGIMELPDPSKINACSLVRQKSSDSDQPSLDCDEVDDNLKVSIGITRLWTDTGFRRRKIASKLCEMMRFHSGIIGVVSKENIAILEPSDSGREFLTKYTEGKGALYTYK